MKKQLLLAEIVKNGYSQEEVAKKIGMSPRTFSRRISKGAFGTDEVIKLVELLHIENTAEIFLSK